MNYRPWGDLAWLLPRLAGKRWDFLGALSMEDRALASWKCVAELGVLNQAHILQIENSISTYAVECDQKIAARRAEFLAAGGSESEIRRISLWGRTGDIEQVFRGLSDRLSVIVDISCIPKRFFFLLIKLLLEKSAAQDIVVTYSIPSSYDQDSPLAEDPEPWSCLPGFLPPVSGSPDSLIVAIGYEPLGLPQILDSSEFQHERINVLFPIPSPGRGLERNWRFAADIARRRKADLSIVRVDNKDVSSVYDGLLRLTGNGRDHVALAPFGPKPIALAMCLYAVLKRAQSSIPVYYTQPRSYSPNYSTGVSLEDGRPEIYGYCIRINGNNLYC